MRIAGELHDVVAHELTLINAPAGGQSANSGASTADSGTVGTTKSIKGHTIHLQTSSGLVKITTSDTTKVSISKTAKAATERSHRHAFRRRRRHSAERHAVRCTQRDAVHGPEHAESLPGLRLPDAQEKLLAGRVPRVDGRPCYRKTRDTSSSPLPCERLACRCIR
jgi:hypothetical protein